jgi:hypothetical protein
MHALFTATRVATHWLTCAAPHTVRPAQAMQGPLRGSPAALQGGRVLPGTNRGLAGHNKP